MEEITMYVIETILPDGPHWYAGLKKQQQGNVVIIGPLWSPYYEDKHLFTDKASAQTCIDINCQKMPGCYAVKESKALRKDSRRTSDGNAMFHIRAKYLTRGNVIRWKGNLLWVHSRSESGIYTRRTNQDNPGPVISPDNNEWVEVISVFPEHENEPHRVSRLN